jgi:hypothetical protein
VRGVEASEKIVSRILTVIASKSLLGGTSIYGQTESHSPQQLKGYESE